MLFYSYFFLILLLAFSPSANATLGDSDEYSEDETQFTLIPTISSLSRKGDESEAISQTPSMSKENPPSQQDEKETLHFYGLQKDHPECGTLLDSRGILTTFQIFGVDYTAWHEESIAHVADMTPKVRRATAYNRIPSKKNVLVHRIDVVFESEFVELESRPGVWVSGWPGNRTLEALKREIPSTEFLTFDSLLPEDKRALTRAEKADLLNSRVFQGYACEQHSYLIPERRDFHRKSCERAKKEVEIFEQQFLHTEQALLLYMRDPKLKKSVKRELKERLDERDVNLVVNMASSQSVCLRCADRMFHESEWGKAFLQEFRQEFQVNLRVHFLASCLEPYKDRLGNGDDSKSLRERLQKEKPAQIGFDGKDVIDFLGDMPQSKDANGNEGGKQPFETSKPLLGQKILKSRSKEKKVE